MRSNVQRRNMDMLIDRNMLEYDRMLREKQEQEGSKRHSESRKNRKQMEEVQKGLLQ
jgi:hypothetical protein